MKLKPKISDFLFLSLTRSKKSALCLGDGGGGGVFVLFSVYKCFAFL